ncbi:MAG: hypothetical protein GVY04_23005 [Cyanobacteria bacterium]|jgi:hypothetical protein|nr:hypothetical protein [Cyanobacteria bacterium GSL.Bin1]
MSTNQNPDNLGTGFFFELEGTLNQDNPSDTYLFTAPPKDAGLLGEVEDSILESLDLFDDIFTERTVLDGTVEISYGIDKNGDQQFQQEEVIGSGVIESNDRVSVADIADDLGIDFLENPGSLFVQPGDDYFLQLETQNPNLVNDYEIDVDSDRGLVEEISTDDSFYCCDGNEDEKYYFDDIDEILGQPIAAGNFGLNLGDTVEVGVVSNDFNPVIFLLNNETGEVIDSATPSQEQEIGDITYQVTFLDFDIQDGISYGLSVETETPGETGDYAIVADA